MSTSDRLKGIRDAVKELAEHEHANSWKSQEDLFCLNLSSWIGERGGAILRIYDEDVAAARREGWAQAIEALRDREAWLEWWRTHPLPSFDEYLNSRAADYLTDRAAALVMPPVAAPVEPAC